MHASCGWCGSGLSNRGESTLLAGESKGDGVPVGSGFQRRQSCLGRKNPMKPEVSWHTTFPEKSSVLYLLQPRSAERGCSVWEQTLSADCRTGGFWRATALKFWICHPANSACSGVGGAAKWRGAAKRSLGMELHRRGRKRYIKLPSRRSDSRYQSKGMYCLFGSSSGLQFKM